MKMRNVFAALVAALSVGIGAYLATDQNAFAQQRPAARQNTTQQTSYFRHTVNFNDGYVAGNKSIRFGRLPANASILRYYVDVKTAFTVASGTGRIFIGTCNCIDGGPTNTMTQAQNILISPTDGGVVPGGAGVTWTSGTVGFTTMLTSPNLGVKTTSAGEVDLWATLVGTTPTTGVAEFTIEFTVANDN